eukprot:tig00001310_g8152.t1
MADLDQEQDNILVAVRCRPLSQRERQIQGNFPVVRVIDRKIVVILDPQEAEEKERDVLRANRSREKRYAFDYAFDGDAGQEEVYEVTGRPMIESVLNGFNATVFAYGATGTGKTYTMIGTVQNPGIMVLIFRDLFERMRDPNSERVSIESKERTPDIHAQVRIGKLSLIDLAGSERAAVTQNRGQRMVEGANINRSLLALGNCINALGDRQNKGSFVPYRDSKLTRLLKDSLGGNCRTVMVATLSPASVTFEETHNTLKYANRAKNIKLKVQRNVMNVTYHISQYTRIIADLRSEISQLKGRLASARAEDGGGAGEQRRPLTDDAERREVQRLRQDIVLNFQERMQLRRSLIDLEDLNQRNAQEIAKRQAEVDEWDAQWPRGPDGRRPEGAPGTPRAVRAARSEVQTIGTNAGKNGELKSQLERRLRENEAVAKNLRFEMPRRVTSAERRELLELEYRIHVLELENMELEEQSLLHDSVLRQREEDVAKLLDQIRVRDKVIEELMARLRDEHQDEAAVPSMPLLERARAELQKIQSGLPPAGSTASGRPPRGTASSLYHTRSSRPPRTNGSAGPSRRSPAPCRTSRRRGRARRLPLGLLRGRGGARRRAPAGRGAPALGLGPAPPDGLPPRRPRRLRPLHALPRLPPRLLRRRPRRLARRPRRPSHRGSVAGASPPTSLYTDGAPRAALPRGCPAGSAAAAAGKAPSLPASVPSTSGAGAGGPSIYRSIARTRSIEPQPPAGPPPGPGPSAAGTPYGSFGGGRLGPRNGSFVGGAAAVAAGAAGRRGGGGVADVRNKERRSAGQEHASLRQLDRSRDVDTDEGGRIGPPRPQVAGLVRPLAGYGHDPGPRLPSAFAAVPQAHAAGQLGLARRWLLHADACGASGLLHAEVKWGHPGGPSPPAPPPRPCRPSQACWPRRSSSSAPASSPSASPRAPPPAPTSRPRSRPPRARPRRRPAASAAAARRGRLGGGPGGRRGGARGRPRRRGLPLGLSRARAAAARAAAAAALEEARAAARAGGADGEGGGGGGGGFPLLALPADVVRLVLRFVASARDLLAISATCRLLRALAADPGLWRRLCRAAYGPAMDAEPPGGYRAFLLLRMSRAKQRPARCRLDAVARPRYVLDVYAGGALLASRLLSEPGLHEAPAPPRPAPPPLSAAHAPRRSSPGPAPLLPALPSPPPPAGAPAPPEAPAASPGSSSSSPRRRRRRRRGSSGDPGARSRRGSAASCGSTSSTTSSSSAGAGAGVALSASLLYTFQLSFFADGVREVRSAPPRAPRAPPARSRPPKVDLEG